MSKTTTRASRSESKEITEVDLVADYQALVAQGVHGERLAKAASCALGPHSDMISRIAYSLARRRYGTAGMAEHLDDVRSEAWRCALEAIANFEPTKQVSVGAWVAGSIQRGVPAAMAQSTRYGAVPTSWERLARIAAEAGRELSQSLGREPTRGELVAELEARCWAWAGGHSEAAKAKLKRAGMLAALEQIDAILAYDRAPMSLDATFGDSDETLGEAVGVTALPRGWRCSSWEWALN